jgi:hypothetical protein
MEKERNKMANDNLNKPHLRLRADRRTIDVYEQTDSSSGRQLYLGPGSVDLNPQTLAKWRDHFGKKTWVTTDFLDQMASLALRDNLPE